MSSYIDKDNETQRLIEMLSEHYHFKCKACKRDCGQTAGELSITEFNNCMDFGLFVKKDVG